MTERDVKWRPYQPPPVILNQPKDQAGSTSPKMLDHAPLPPQIQSSKYQANLAYSTPGSTIPVKQASSGNDSLTVDPNKKVHFSNSQIVGPVQDHDKNYYKVTIKDHGKEQNLLVGKEGTRGHGFVLKKETSTTVPKSPLVSAEKAPVKYTAHKLDDTKAFYGEMRKLHFDTTGAKYIGLVGEKGNQYEKFELKDGKKAYIGNDPKNKGYGYLEGESVKKMASHTTTQLKNQIPDTVIAKRELDQLGSLVNEDPNLKRAHGVIKTADAFSKAKEELAKLFTDEKNAQQVFNPEKPALTKEEALRKLGEGLASDPNLTLAGALHNLENRKEAPTPDTVDAIKYIKELIGYHHQSLATSEQQSLQKNIDRLEKLDPKILKEKFPEYYDAQQNWKTRQERGGELTALDKYGPDGMRFYNGQFDKVCRIVKRETLLRS